MSSSQANYSWNDFYWLLEPAIIEYPLFVIGVGQRKSFIFGVSLLIVCFFSVTCIAEMGELTVHVIKGSNLKIADHFVRSSDPYVVITSGEQIRSTRVKKRTLNPVWEEVFTFTDISYPDHRFLIMEVFDEDKAPKLKRKDFLGEAKIDLKPLIREKTDGKKLVAQSSNNHLARDSWIVPQNDGRLVQDVSLKLAHVKSGFLEMKLEWQPESKS